jgi:MFS family permease
MIGVSISLWHPAALTYLSLQYPGSRGFVLSVHSIGASIGDALSPLLAAFLLTYVTINNVNLSWNVTSGILSIPLFIVMFIILFYLKDKNETLSETDNKKSKQENYFYNLKLLLKNVQLIPLFLIAGVRTVTQNGILVFMPLYLVANQGVSAAAVIGASLFTMQIGGLFSGPIAGYLSDKHGRKIIAVGALLVSSILAPLYIIVESNLLIITLSGLMGFAIYAGRPVVQGWALDMAPEKTSGSVIGLLFMVQVGSAAIFAIIAGIIADIYGLEIIFIILSVICLLTLALASLISYPKSV